MTETSPPADASNADKPAPSLAEQASELGGTVFVALALAMVVRLLLFQPFTIPSASMEPTLYEGDYIIVSKFSYGWSRHSIQFSPPLFRGRVLGREPHRGDVIVFKLPRDNSKDYIKRLIGLPGDRIQVKGGQLYINDQAVKRTALQPGDATCPGLGVVPQVPRFAETLPNGVTHSINSCLGTTGPADNTGVYVVPPHCYFMMGDNRDNSSDSRFNPLVTPDVAEYNGCPWDPALDEALGAAALEGGVGFVPAENLEGKADLILFSWKPGASLFKPWTWFLEARWNRFLHPLK
jgi:signal peptidase I